MTPGNDRRSIATFGIIALLILGMAVVNFTNLATARAGQRALGQVLADEVDRRDERLGLDGQQAGRAGEVVGVGLGVDLDPAVVVDLGVEHVGAAAEVHDVQDVDVLAQLGPGDLQALADLLGLEHLPRPLDVDGPEQEPARIVEEAVHGMLPKTKMGEAMYRKLKVYAGPDHPHTAQKPSKLEVA